MLKYFIFIIFLGVTLTASAQLNFSGAWKIWSKEHIDGPPFINVLPESINITQTGDSLIVNSREYYSQDSLIDRTVRYHLKGGVVSGISKSNHHFERVAHWLGDKKTLILTNTVYTLEDTTKPEVVTTETWTISGDGELSIHRKAKESKSQNWEAEGLFKRK